MDKTEHILVGFDFSPCSTLALQYGIDLAVATGADLDILFIEVLHGEVFNTTAKEKMEQLVHQQLLLRGNPEVQVEQTVERYFAVAPAILEHAERTGADLIVLGTHGRRGLRALMLGSVAQEVVRSADLPVMTIRCRTIREMKPHRIDSLLVPFDFSTHSRQALAQAVGIAKTFGSSINVLHVIEDRFHPAFYGPFFQSIYDLDPNIKEKAIAHLTEEVAPLIELGFTVDVAVVAGYPSTEIAAYAEQRHVDLIVMSTHGLTGFERLSLGSVTERTVSSATCPVLTLRNKSLEVLSSPGGRPNTEELQEV